MIDRKKNTQRVGTEYQYFISAKNNKSRNIWPGSISWRVPTYVNIKINYE